jgi:orotate phosphoribosyltransferase
MTASLTALADLLLDAGVLSFGDFTTKSGRATPYFLDFGRVRTGPQVTTLASLYATTIDETFGRDVDVLFGPAYKGIPLAVATAQALSVLQDREVGFCFDRKEAKDHGEGGLLVGAVPVDGDRVVIVEDVTTAGTSIRETVPKLRAVAPAVEVVGLVIAVDRAERAPDSDRSALDVVATEFDLVAAAVTDIDTLVEHLRDRGGVLGADDIERIATYRTTWGA